MLDELDGLVAGTRTLVGALDPDALSGPDARTAVENFAELERFAAAGKAMALGRLDRTGAWVGDGSFRDIESWLGSISGTTFGAARSVANTARRLRDLPATAEAVRAGDVSLVEADAISTAATADPTSERALLDTAAIAGVRGLKVECDRVTAAALSAAEELERYEHAHTHRALTHHASRDGSGRIEIRGPLDRTAQMMAAIAPYERELFDEHRRAGRPEHPDATAFDAMARLCERHTAGAMAPKSTRGTTPLATIVVHVSNAAYQRGHTIPGEICEIDGAGPIPVAVARRLGSDAVVKAVVGDGVDVRLVSHLGRTIPTHLRTAIETRDRTCVIAGCETARHLEIDHNVPHAICGPTELANLARLCHHHHDQKTRRDLRRVGPLPNQRLVSVTEYERSMNGRDRAPPGSKR